MDHLWLDSFGCWHCDPSSWKSFLFMLERYTYFFSYLLSTSHVVPTFKKPLYLVGCVLAFPFLPSPVWPLFLLLQILPILNVFFPRLHPCSYSLLLLFSFFLQTHLLQSSHHHHLFRDKYQIALFSIHTLPKTKLSFSSASWKS